MWETNILTFTDFNGVVFGGIFFAFLTILIFDLLKNFIEKIT